jgi:hypothetical protein
MALLVAPVCAPFCAAHTCIHVQSRMASETHCHDEAAENNNSSQMHALLECNSPELPVAAFKTLQMPRSASRETGQVAGSPEFDGVLSVNYSRGTNSAPLRSSDPFLAISVLRI